MTNEVRTTSATGAEKGVKDERVGLVPPEAILALSRVYAMGSRKYADHNFRKGYEWSKSFDALQRHALQWWSGEDLDPESGESHLMHVAWHAFALWLFTQDHPGYDDRYSTIVKAGTE